MDAASTVGLQGIPLPGAWLRRLLRRYLPPADRLSYFQASRSTAAAVLRNSYTVHQSQAAPALFEGSDTPAPYSVTLVLDTRYEQGASQQQLQGRWRVLQSILHMAAEASTRVVLDHGISAGWAYLPARQITAVGLTDMDLPPDLETLLPLQQCSNLHTLSIMDVGCDQQQGVSPSALSTLSEQQKAAFHAPSLASLRVYEVQAWGGLWAWGLMVGAKVKHLTYCLDPSSNRELRDFMKRTASIPPSFSVLTHFETDGGLSDTLLDGLAVLPAMTHVTAAGILLRRCHLKQHLQWQQLTLTGTRVAGAFLLGTHHIRLHDIRGIVVQGGIHSWGQEAEHVTRQLTAHPFFQCEPDHERCPAGSLFEVHGQYTAGTVSACAHALTQGPVWLSLELTTPKADLLPVISGLPLKVTTLAFYCHMLGPTLQINCLKPQQEFMHQVAGALPPHITSICLFSDTTAHIAWAKALIPAVAAAKPHVKVAMGSPSHDRSTARHQPLLPLVRAHPGRVYTYHVLQSWSGLQLVKLKEVAGRVVCVPTDE